eukprot:988200-Prymnesium_polylepis.1
MPALRSLSCGTRPAPRFPLLWHAPERFALATNPFWWLRPRLAFGFFCPWTVSWNSVVCPACLSCVAVLRCAVLLVPLCRAPCGIVLPGAACADDGFSVGQRAPGGSLYAPQSFPGLPRSRRRNVELLHPTKYPLRNPLFLGFVSRVSMCEG